MLTIIKDLKKESTFVTLFYNFITLGVYGGFYMKRQTEILNKDVKDDLKISSSEMDTYVVLSIISAFISFLLIFSDNNPTFEGIDKLFTIGLGIWMIAWNFRWRKMFYAALGDDAQYPSFRLNGFFLFLFGIYYINYKINEFDSFTSVITATEQPTNQ